MHDATRRQRASAPMLLDSRGCDATAAVGLSRREGEGSMDRRNAVLGLLATFAGPLPAVAQTARRPRRIGFLAIGGAQADAPFLAAFRAGMQELGWVDERDYVLDVRDGKGVLASAPGMADELIASGPDLLLGVADGSSRLMAQRTKAIPIVFAITQDPVGAGLAENLRKPGGNATGLTSMTTELWGKRLQLLKEVLPRVTHVALLYAPNDQGAVSQLKEIRTVAPRLGISVTPLDLRQPADIEPAIRRATAIGAQACAVTFDAFTNNQRQAIADHLARQKLPAMFAGSLWVEAGGLMAYSTSFADNFRRAAAYVDKILKGAKPGDLSIEQPTKFDLAVNMKTATALGIRFPEAFLLSVTRVID
ncbi:MAG: ABC transporter substrate-binding protein [Burkholderiales bacterium]|nr:ABC transporter substrate-binding protein [Burkholderiales bacterium]